jgi:ribose transport system permease protein
MTAVIVLGGIDLSVGSIYALAAIIGAQVLSGVPPDTGMIAGVLIGLLVCCAVGGACGFANAVMIVGLRVHPFIITLGTMAIYRGIVFVRTEGQSVGGFPDSFQQGFFKLAVRLGNKPEVYPVPSIIMVIVALCGAVVLSRLVVGRRVFAIGGNETAARYAGIPVRRVKLLVYTAMGALAGLSACMYIGYFGAAEPNAGQAYELRVIAAAVIGGASLSGGRGSAIGAVLGAIIVELISNGMLILHINQSYTQIVMGAAIILAVVVDQLKSRLGPSA